jgi:uncharacterized protein with von Willebrand factor type A (vWA) domain
MFLDFFFDLRRFGVKVTPHEWMTLCEALILGLHDSSLKSFYSLARSICVRDESEYDAFDQAFLHHFHGVAEDAFNLSQQLEEWLKNPKQRMLTEEERKLLQSLDLDALRKLFEERLREQKERHQGGNRWIGTGGTSPFGNSGVHPSGIRIGPGGGRSAMQVAGERRYRDYRNDRVLDVRQIDIALRRLRRLGREGAPEELDLDETIDATSKNAGELDLKFHPPKRNRLKLTLLMDVGGSMDPHAELVERLFSAASRAGRFARFRHFYFHNCVYQAVYRDARFRERLMLSDLFHTSDQSERLVIVGDALMHPGELLYAGGAIDFSYNNPVPGIEWLRRLSKHFPHSAWLNPEPERYWPQTTIQLIADIFPMYFLSVDGLHEAVKYLVGHASPSAAGLRQARR